MVEHPAVLGDIVGLAAEGQLLAHLAVQRVAAVAFVDHDAVVGVDRQRLLAVENPPHQALDGGDLHPGVGIGLQVTQALQVVDRGERLAGLEHDVAKGIAGLLAESAAIDDE